METKLFKETPGIDMEFREAYKKIKVTNSMLRYLENEYYNTMKMANINS